MRLPFSREAFLDVFAVYNTSLWPIAAVLWVATAVVFAGHMMGRGKKDWTVGLLAFHWAWAGIAYHAMLFSRINPAAWAFAALFLVEASLFVLYGVVRGRLQWSRENTVQERVAYILIAYGLLYPAIAPASGHSYPRVPTFGVPCPTTIVTVGFLMLVARPVPRLIVIVPLLWAAIGGSAAFLLGMPADLALLAAGVALGVCLWPRNRHDVAGRVHAAPRLAP